MTIIQSFDNTESVESRLFRPDRFKQLFEHFSGSSVITRGAGLSYCNAGVVAGGCTVLSTRFNRFLAFDKERYIIRVEPGVSLGELFEFAVTHSLMPPVLPGHPRITVGGALAMNAHGKNQFRTGNFGDHVRHLTLYHPRYGELSCSPDKNPELFRLTIGGFGLTGHILSADIALEPLRGKSMDIERIKVDGLIGAVDAMENFADRADCLYSWHDLNRTGNKFGCGTVYLERFSNGELRLQPAQPTTAAIKPLFWPLLNRLTAPLICRSYDIKENMAPRHEVTDLYRASFPIVGKEIYFRLFGQRGFREYQAIFPKESWRKVVEQVMAAIKVSGTPITLASLKLFHGERRLLNFSGEGICLAIDTPNSANSIELFSRLDDITINAGGIANISKDSRLSAETIRAMYGNGYDQFRSALCAHDPDAHFQSELRRRLDV